MCSAPVTFGGVLHRGEQLAVFAENDARDVERRSERRDRTAGRDVPEPCHVVEPATRGERVVRAEAPHVNLLRPEERPPLTAAGAVDHGAIVVPLDS